ncbi:MAG: YkgJ family cysteine cluster protein [Phycisphaerae bacterium]
MGEKKDKWYSCGLKFACTQCGNCCSGAPGYVWASKEEIRRISVFLGRTDGWLDKEHLRRVGLWYSLTEKPGGDCIFLAHANGRAECTIYAVRPLQCRTWPFWTQNLRSTRTWEEVSKICPGVNVGQHHDFVQIETIRTKKTW